MQIENEYEPEAREFGAAGYAYMNWAAKMAVKMDTGVPWVMCKESDAPDPVVSNISIFFSCFPIQFYSLINMVFLVKINTCNGFYCDYFSPNKPYKPTFWTEAWTAW